MIGDTVWWYWFFPFVLTDTSQRGLLGGFSRQCSSELAHVHSLNTNS